MFPEIGHFALILAFCFAMLQGLIPLWGVIKKNDLLMIVAPRLAYAQTLLLLVSFFILTGCFVVNDFSVNYVAEHSHTKLPMIYRICAVWGAHEGSMLLWVMILGCWSAGVAKWSRILPLDMQARVLIILAWIAAGFELFILQTSNPFLRILMQIPLEGHELNPLLQDPGLVSHPPMLYIGYVGFAVAFAFALTALWKGELDATWANWARPWTLLAWCFLTLGIVLGSWWAYRELGWGGWWFWDPVENASLMPWLSGTALIHSLAVTAKRQLFRAWTVLLAITTFCLSLLGTFIVRSGVLVSVHAFAVDPERGVFVLAFLAIVAGGSLLWYASRAGKFSSHQPVELWSRESALFGNNILLIVMMLTVLLGTLYPLIMESLHLGKLSVGPPYFDNVLFPLALPLLFLIGLGPGIKWKRDQISLVLARFRLSLMMALVLAVCLPIFIIGRWSFGVVISLSLAFWIVLSTIKITRDLKQRSLSHFGMMVSHIGVGIITIGIALSTTYSEQREVSLRVGEQVSIGPYQFVLENVTGQLGSNYQADEASVLVKHNNQTIANLHPQQRFFPASNMILAKTAIDVGFFRDLYVALGQHLPENKWGLRLYYKPFVRWIWMGGLVIVLGGLLATLARVRERNRESG